MVAAAHEASDGIFGYRRVRAELLDDGMVVSLHMVRRLMREQDLAGAQPRAYRVTTKQDADAEPAPDLLERDFASDEPGSRLVGDITYIRTWAGWAYLAVVIDLASKMIVGWSVSNRASAVLVIDALEMAHRNGHVGLDAIFHSDRGCTPRARSGTSAAGSSCANRWDAPASAGTTRKRKRSSPR